MVTQLSPQKRRRSPLPNFRPISTAAKQLDASRCTWYRRRPQPSPPLHKKEAEPPIFGPCLLWQNGCINQDLTWYGGRPQPRRILCEMGTQLPSPKSCRARSPIFGSCLLWPNGWMDQDGTWRRGGRWSRPHCARWGPSSLPPKRGTAPQFSAHVYCGQTAGWTKMPLGMEVGLGPGDCVRWGPSSPPQKRDRAPKFGPIFIVAKRLDGSRWHLVWR